MRRPRAARIELVALLQTLRALVQSARPHGGDGLQGWLITGRFSGTASVEGIVSAQRWLFVSHTITQLRCVAL